MKALTKSLLAAAAGLLIGVGAQAATVEGTLFGGAQQLSDNSAEALINMGGSPASTVDVGDRLRGIFTIETVEPLGGGTTRNLGAGSGNHELTGVFDVTVVAKVGGPGAWSFVFAPTASFAAEAGGNLGAAVAFYQDATPDYSRLNPGCTTTGLGGDCEALISGNDASLLWVAGFGSAEAFWTANAITDDITVIGSFGSGQAGGFFNIGLDLLANLGTKTFLAVSNCFNPLLGANTTQIEFCGSGSLLGRGGAATPYDSFDNVDITINLVPEPASIALAGLALLGLGASARRRKN